MEHRWKTQASKCTVTDISVCGTLLGTCIALGQREESLYSRNQSRQGMIAKIKWQRWEGMEDKAFKGGALCRRTIFKHWRKPGRGAGDLLSFLSRHFKEGH